MSGENRDELLLIERCNAGDAEAFAALYRNHRQWAFSLAIRFLGNRDDASDALQDVFAYFFRQFPGFRLTSTIRAFLYPVIKHTSLSIARRRRNVVDLDSVRKHGMEAEIGLSWESETRGDFERLIRPLPPDHQEVVRLRFVLDMRLHEIADALNIPVGTVKSRLHTALSLLRKENPPPD